MRRGQLFSMDALISLVLVIMVLGTVSATSENLRGEIASMIGWYERANIADSMLDVLMKSPGEPEDWESGSGTVKVVGLRDRRYPFALDYRKIIALNGSKAKLEPILNQLAHEKDFLFEIYISTFNVSVSGGFPRIYLDGITLPENDTANVVVSGRGEGNDKFSISYILLIRDNTRYLGEDICSLARGKSSRVPLYVGDYLAFVTTEEIQIQIRGQGAGTTDIATLPSNTKVELVILDSISQYSMDITGCGTGNISEIHIGGSGKVQLKIWGYDDTIPRMYSNYTRANDFLEGSRPFYWFSLINGTLEPDMDKVRESMSRSPWIETAVRRVTFLRPAYNLSAGPSAEEPIIYGFMKYNVLEGEAVRIAVDSESYGNLTMIAQLGTEVRGLFLYGNNANLNATLVWYEYENGTRTPKLKKYTGTDGTIIVPFRELFGSTEAQNQVIVLWLYSLNGWPRDKVNIQFVPDIKYMIEPKFDETIVKLLVWDDS